VRPRRGEARSALWRPHQSRSIIGQIGQGSKRLWYCAPLCACIQALLMPSSSMGVVDGGQEPVAGRLHSCTGLYLHRDVCAGRVPPRPPHLTPHRALFCAALLPAHCLGEQRQGL